MILLTKAVWGNGNSLTIEERNILRNFFYKHPTDASSRIQHRFFQAVGRSVTSWTVKNYRRCFGFHPVHARTQPLLKRDHAQQRLTFSVNHVNYDWSRVIFSNEIFFEVDSSGIVHWIPYGRTQLTSFTSQVKYRIAVFGAVWYNRKSDLIFIRDATNTERFVNYLKDALHSHRRSIKNYYFIHDHLKWAHTTLSHDKTANSYGKW